MNENPEMLYRAVWYSIGKIKAYGEFTSKQKALKYLRFLKQHREAWLEDSNGKRIGSDDNKIETEEK